MAETPDPRHRPLSEAESPKTRLLATQEFADDKVIALDVRARDSAGRWLNIEMQVMVSAGLLQRLVYCACTM